MAPVVNSAIAILAIAGSVVEAGPFIKPGRHSNPHLQSSGILSTSKRSLHSLLARYYGSKHGLSKPPPLPEKRDTTLPSGWSYFGCVSESWEERLLQGFAYSSSAQTPLLCVTQCTKLGYTYAATEYGDECYCGNEFVGTGGGRAEDSTCNVPCEGDTSENCGAAWYLSLYQYNSTELASCVGTPATSTIATLPAATAEPTTVVVNGTTSIGLGAIATTGSVPTASVTANSTETIALPTSVNATSPTTATATASATTSAAYPVYTDAADSSEWYSLGCAIDSENRLLTGSSKTGFTGMTIDKCLSYCEDAGFRYAGAEYGDECYCSNALPAGIQYQNDWNCNVVCDGNSTEACGGGYALELFELVSAAQNETDCTTTSGTVIATGTTKTTGATTTASIVVPTTTAVGTTKAATTTSQAAATTVPATTQTAPASTESHYVWAHHMVGNTYPYTQSNWANDISLAQAAGIDGFALNMGSDSWQVDRISDAYAAAGSSGFKLFLSLDMTVLPCGSSGDAQTLVNLVKRFASQAAQAKHDGKVLVSTFAGSDCAISWQNDFVNALDNSGTNIFFVPSIFSNPNTFAGNNWMDGELNWNSGWPMGANDLDTSSDKQYMSALGSKEYWAAVSPFFFTHFSPATWNKNWLYKSDEWLYATRWEDLISMRDQVKSIEILTWNDYGESSYIGPIEGALPAGSDVWTNGFDHQSLNSLTKYYAQAFKTGSYPTIEKDEIIMWARPHSHDATASNDSTGKPTGWNYTQDYLWVVVLATADSQVTLTSGSNSQTFSVSAGLNKLKLSLSEGSISGSITRSGQTIASYNAGSAFTYTTSPQTYNYNYFVGSSSS